MSLPIDPAGAEYGQYRLIRPISRSADRITYLARDPANRRIVRLSAIGLTKDGLAKFRRTVHRSVELRHPHISPILDYGEISDRAFVITESGQTLTDRVDAKISLGTAKHWVLTILDTLEYGEEHGICHGNINLNTIIFLNGQLKLTEFGLWDVPDQQFHEFVAPDREGQATPASDIYAVGVLLFRLLTGEIPGPKRQLPAVVRSRISATLDGAVAAALAQPERRFKNAKSMRQLIEADPGVRKPEIRTEQRQRGKSHQQEWKFALATVIVGACLLGGVGLRWWIEQSHQETSLPAAFSKLPKLPPAATIPAPQPPPAQPALPAPSSPVQRQDWQPENDAPVQPPHAVQLTPVQSPEPARHEEATPKPPPAPQPLPAQPAPEKSPPPPALQSPPARLPAANSSDSNEKRREELTRALADLRQAMKKN